jgi:hypothetical protein
MSSVEFRIPLLRGSDGIDQFELGGTLREEENRLTKERRQKGITTRMNRCNQCKPEENEQYWEKGTAKQTG